MWIPCACAIIMSTACASFCLHRVIETQFLNSVSQFMNLILFMSHTFYITQKSMFSSELSLALQTLLVPFLVWFVIKKKTAVECLIEIRVI